MSDLAATSLVSYTPATPSQPKTDDPRKIHEAAQQFEALLIGQILETVSRGDGWLGSGEDSSSGCANGFAQEQLAVAMSKQGGFGLAKLISAGLERAR
jgi:Rod binding domain-containing protein